MKKQMTYKDAGVDIDAEVLAWGRANNIGKLTEDEQSRIEVIEGDVFKVKTRPVDAVLAIFSYGLGTARDAFEQEEVQLFALTDFEALLRAASDAGTLDSSDVDTAAQWHERLTAGETGGAGE